MNNKRFFTVACLLSVAASAAMAPDALSKKAKRSPIDGAAVFKQNCQSCHVGGGNTVNPNKPLAGSEKLASQAIFKSYLETPLGHMPYYKHVVTDKATLEALYKYCKSLKPGKGA